MFGARGVVTLELTVYGPVKALHDGHYGNWVPNPIVALTHLLDSMRDENGRILIDGFYDDVVPPASRKWRRWRRCLPSKSAAQGVSDRGHRGGRGAAERTDHAAGAEC